MSMMIKKTNLYLVGITNGAKVLAFVFLLNLIAISCTNTPDIVVQNLNMQLANGSRTFSEELLNGEIADTKIEHFAYVGPTKQTIPISKEYVNMFLFIKGNGKLNADTLSFQIVPESIAIPTNFNNIHIDVAQGDTLHYISFTKKLTTEDYEDLDSYPQENKHDIFFTKFSDCEPYTEKIKSPKTVSRTVLPQDIIPRVALGTVETVGPDEVGAHKHPMLDQLFLGLTANDVVVHADDKSVELGAYSLLHIPIGSSHWVTVEKEKKMYYMWMDFFIDREGQEWLKTHKPMATDKKDY
jgi:mannose-6-phosphate isomerase-like protein (cupin superfamily)